MRILTLLILLISNSTLIAQANLMESKAKLQSVTVYNSSAQLNYEQNVDVSKGKTSIVFTDLTPYIVDNTLNVSIDGDAVDIVNVSDRINHIRSRKANNEKISALKDSIKRLKVESGLLQCKVDALNKEKELLFRNEAIGGVSEGVAVDEIEKAADFFSKRYYRLNTELYYLAEKETKILKKQERFNKQMSSLGTNTNKPGSEIEITVLAKSRKSIKVKFSFLTSKGGWAPMYDCKFQGPDKPIKFVFRANVFNACGTPWNNISIKLSTASPTQGFNAPSINDQGGRTVAANDGKVKFKTIQVANAIATYDIKHKQTVPSDSKPYLMDVDSYEMAASFHYLIIPKLDPFGFLMAKVPDWNKYNLIPGSTNVYNQGSYMGKTFLNTYAENDTLDIYLGKDGKIQTSKKEKIKNNKNAILGNYFLEKADISLSVSNVSDKTLPIVVLDQVPVFSAKGSTKFNIQNIDNAIYDQSQGLLTWKIELEGGTNQEISYNYEIKEPKDVYEAGKGAYKPKKRSFRTISCPAF